MLRCVAMLGLLAGGAGAWAAEPVKICLGGGNEWPPFTYWERHDGKPDQSRLTGSAATLVLTALKHLGYDYDVSYLPWARVQQELADYASHQNCEVTWDASYTPERAAFAHYSEPLYHTRLGLFYSATRFPSPPDIKAPGALASQRLCGVIGYNYDPYGITDEPQRVASVQQALDLVTRQRCDLFPSEIEPLYGGIELGAYRADGTLRYLVLPSRKAFYLLVARSSPRGEALVKALNGELRAMNASGETEAIFQRFRPAGLDQPPAGAHSQ